MFGKKKYSPKVKAQSRHWLEQNGYLLEQLTEEQQEELFKLTKTKRALVWLIPISLIMFFVYIGVMIYGIKVVSEIKINTAPEYYVTEGTDGEEEVKEIPKEIQESFNTHGNVLVLFGIILGYVIYAGINVLISLIASYFTYKRHKKVMLVFLPLANPEETNNIELLQL